MCVPLTVFVRVRLVCCFTAHASSPASVTALQRCCAHLPCHSPCLLCFHRALINVRCALSPLHDAQVQPVCRWYKLQCVRAVHPGEGVPRAWHRYPYGSVQRDVLLPRRPGVHVGAPVQPGCILSSWGVVAVAVRRRFVRGAGRCCQLRRLPRGQLLPCAGAWCLSPEIVCCCVGVYLRVC